MDSTDPAEGPDIVFRSENEAEAYRAKWLWSLTQFREAFNDWRNVDENQTQDWWLASTAIPLAAATTAPLANLMSVVALVTSWRNKVHPHELDSQGRPRQTAVPDPTWSIALNASSLVFGVLGNLFLLFNFTRKMRYIVALPASMCLWFLATGLLVGISISLEIYAPPIPPDQVFSQGYWSAVIAATLYFILAVMLMINLLGYMLDHYPGHFALTDDQRTLILQTTSFMVWLAVGAAVYQKLVDITFADALYFSDVTVLTLGYGDITTGNDVARGLILPYAVIGIIILALIVASISRFAREVTNANVVKAHLHRRRAQVLQRSNAINEEYERFAQEPSEQNEAQKDKGRQRTPLRDMVSNLRSNRSRTLVMREEKERFDAMRAIQDETLRFRRWMSLFMSLISFAVVWCGGAAVFSALEGITYFNGLYFGFCSLLTIGYGDITPQSNGGRPFFIVWSLIAIPTMTILISKMSDTILAVVNTATNFVAEFTLLPEQGRYTRFISQFRIVREYLERRAEAERIERGFPIGVQDPENVDEAATKKRGVNDYERAEPPPRTFQQLEKDRRSPPRLARDLIFAIRRVTQHVVAGEIKRYSYEEWVEFTQLIRFTNPNTGKSPDIALDENEWGLIEWDWMGENSPMMAEQTEPEWVLNRLTESLLRYMASIESQHEGEDKPHSLSFRGKDEDKDNGGDPRAVSSSDSRNRRTASAPTNI
ncbi:potassium channel, putative [Talaromyces stipitatus ATCC 10500]|uniref:Potassium channel, putative n=1 Tax=Talaromyces stipitatus (strain ATCC 10500 / CBS 375.48 / QM 6759 / NRRL 1006) TaxID=441959 RepID=B8M580_TALSN|nr:potassium channel, putative [Talaromyces stipitatus ATCC 10500]EED19686.1 potassium channel, putative [Talaromyces stipitatus ATCC 10500]